jgi:hypothetical protein
MRGWKGSGWRVEGKDSGKNGEYRMCKGECCGRRKGRRGWEVVRRIEAKRD